MSRRFTIAGAALVAVAAIAGQVSTAAAQSAPEVRTLSDELGAPFNLALRNGDVLVADGGLGQVLRIHERHVRSIVEDAPGTAGIAVRNKGGVFAYTTTVGDPMAETTTSTSVELATLMGEHLASADTFTYEKTANPDQGTHFGLTDPTECQTATLESVDFPVSYSGAIDSHPYSLVAFRGGWVLADAGGNDLLWIDDEGTISTLAVLPPQPAVITQEAADELGLDECIVGETYAFEPVPTDVEARHGELYVTTLPGGPESAALGARGAVWRLDPDSGKLTQLATGILGATNVAVPRWGGVYVTELFGGRISEVTGGEVHPVLDLPGALAVEAGWRKGVLYAGTLDLSGANPGTVVRIQLHP
jgi:hypothetical protein